MTLGTSTAKDAKARKGKAKTLLATKLTKSTKCIFRKPTYSIFVGFVDFVAITCFSWRGLALFVVEVQVAAVISASSRLFSARWNSAATTWRSYLSFDSASSWSSACSMGTASR